MEDNLSNDSSPEHVIPPAEENVLTVDERIQQLSLLKALFDLPQYNIDDDTPGSSFRRAAPSPVQYFSGEDINMPGCSYSNPQMTGSSQWGGDMSHRTIDLTNFLQSEVCPLECPTNRKIYQPGVLIIISTALQTVPENPNFWKSKKRFPSSRSAYICRMPKLLLANGIICHTLRFIADSTIFNFRMKLQLVCKRRILDEWLFEKGFVCRQVITVWETMITRSPELDYLIDPTLIARAILKTKFYDGDQLLHKYKACIIFT